MTDASDLGAEPLSKGAQLDREVDRRTHDVPGGFSERVIVCGSPESGLVRPWHPTIRFVESHIFWYGDNLTVMREHIRDESVDLIYLDPPFNSHRVYNRFFGESDGVGSDAQRRAFEDYWSWGAESEEAYDEIVHPRQRRYSVPAGFSQTMEMLRGILHESNLLAYLSMMAVRMIEMRRVLKQTGSLYLHCDSTASHYLKLLLDSLFGVECYRNDINWVRTNAHNFKSRIYPRVSDTILFYTKSQEYTWTTQRAEYSDAQMKRFKCDPGSTRLFKAENLTMVGNSAARFFTWRGSTPKQGRVWGMSKERLEELWEEGRILKKLDGSPRLDGWKIYLDETDGKEVSCNWDDVARIGNTSDERTGYPTQKPVALLERIIRASSNEGDVILDPFCGCGTAVVAGQKLNRKWIGIDITHVAVSVLKKRLEKEFPGLEYRVRGEPEDIASARRLADEKWEEFQAWVVDRVGGIPLNPEEEKKVAKKGKDGGVDGYFLFRDDPKAARSKRMILSVKAGKSLTPEMIDALHGVVTRENAAAGVLLTAYKPTPGMYKTAAAYGSFSSEIFEPGKKYPKIQIITVDDIFDSRWRGLNYPGSNTSRRSEPPVGTSGASEELFKPKPLKKPRIPDEQLRLGEKPKR